LLKSSVITKLNLSSTPFRNRALPWTVTAIITVFSFIALIFIAKATFQTNAQAQTTAHDVAKLREQSAALNKQADDIQKALTPEQQRDLKSAHALINRKQFSWSRLFADLEAALPRDVRVTRITVKDVLSDGDGTVANLELVVASKSSTIVTDMIQNMQREGVFQAQLTAQNPQHGRGESGSEYELNVSYAPRAGASINAAERNNRPVDTASPGAGTR
jgi:Tfp pilus assembly protein PilN